MMKTYEELCAAAEEVIEEGREEVTALSDVIADRPELSGEEYFASASIKELLEGHGFTVELPFAGWETAVRAITGRKQTHKVAILTEYDALPGLGHACAHCLSAGISVLAGLGLKDLEEELDTEIHVIGTPAEEGQGGKASMALNGVFDDYDMAIMIHLFDKNWADPYLLATDWVRYTFHGKSAHAASAPWDGVNALNAAQLTMHAVDMLRQHVTPDVRIHGMYRHVGDAINVVPERAVLEFQWRCDYRETLGILQKQLDDCARGAAIATGCTMERERVGYPYYELRRNGAGAEAIKEVFGEMGLTLTDKTKVPFASSDVGNVSFCCPTFQPCLQLMDEGVSLHTPAVEEMVRTDRAHDTMVLGGKIIARSILKIFTDPARIAAMAEEFEEQKG